MQPVRSRGGRWVGGRRIGHVVDNMFRKHRHSNGSELGVEAMFFFFSFLLSFAVGTVLCICIFTCISILRKVLTEP